jgi:hypothetical protein
MHTMYRLRAGAVAAALLAVTAGSLLATPALAGTSAIAPDYITVDTPSSPDSNLGLLSVQVDSTTPITTLALHVLNQSTQADLLDPAVTQDSGIFEGSYYVSTWTVTTPITMAQLPLGDYSVTADATDQGGTTATGAYAGPWEFTPYPEMTLTASRTEIDYNHQSATVTGTVKLEQPDGTLTSYTGPITLDQLWQSTPASTVQATNGSFSATVSPTAEFGSSPSLYAWLPDSGANRVGQAVASFTVNVDPLTVQATQSPQYALYGSKAALAGSVKYTPFGSSTPEPVTTPVKVELEQWNSDGYPTVAGTVTTNSSGNFSFPVAPNPETYWQLFATPATDLIGTQNVTIYPTASFSTVITVAKDAVNSHKKASFAACFGLASAGPVGIGGSSSLRIQYATHKTGPWSNLTTTLSYGVSCGHDGQHMDGFATVKKGAAYYRVYFPGTPRTGSYSFDSSASSVFYLRVP